MGTDRNQEYEIRQHSYIMSDGTDIKAKRRRKKDGYYIHRSFNSLGDTSSKFMCTWAESISSAF